MLEALLFVGREAERRAKQELCLYQASGGLHQPSASALLWAAAPERGE